MLKSSSPPWFDVLLKPAESLSIWQEQFRKSLERHGWPHPKQEGWREFAHEELRNLQGMKQIQGIVSDVPANIREWARQSYWWKDGCQRYPYLCLFNGVWWSQEKGLLPDGVSCVDNYPLERVLHHEWIERLTRNFSATLNLIHHQQFPAVTIHPLSSQSDRVLHLDEIGVGLHDPVRIHPVLLVYVQSHTSITLLHTLRYESSQLRSLWNPLIFFYVEPHAQVRYLRLIDVPDQTLFLGSHWVILSEDTIWEQGEVLLNTGTIRDEANLRLCGEGANVRIYTLSIPDQGHLHDLHIRIEHEVGSTQSYQLIKGINCEKSRGNFHGHVRVYPNAQKVEARQLSHYLLLAPSARSHSEPHLEIYADDVVCSHGATVGQLDQEQLFYLQTRGMDYQLAKTLLVLAFAAEVAEKIPFPLLRSHLTEHLFKQFLKE